AACELSTMGRNVCRKDASLQKHCIEPETHADAVRRTQRLVARAASRARVAATLASFNLAISCRHAIEVCKHSLILFRISLGGELAMQLLVAVGDSAILRVDVIARVAISE